VAPATAQSASALLDSLSPSDVESIFSSDDPADYDLQKLLYSAATHPYYTFQPRPDLPAEFDEQSDFVEQNYQFDPAGGPAGKGAYSYDPDEPWRFKVCLGGTGSGKTHASAFKTAQHVLETPPPRERCPFWIIGSTMDQVCQAAWVEKLAALIPGSEIIGCTWHDAKRRWPTAVMLRYPDRRKDEKGGDKVGWVLEFKSYEQGLGGMKAISIGGYWFNEEVPFHHVAEVQGRCRDYDSPGWADFTPIECRDAEWPEAYDKTPATWRFYHLNTEKNDALPADWFPNFISSVPEDLRELRTVGKFTALAGSVFKEFRKSIHVIDWDQFRDLTGHRAIPRDWRKMRGIDFGYNNPFACLWIAKDHDGRYYVYDEHFEAQRLLAYHAEKINERPWEANSPWHGATYSDHDPQDMMELAQHGIHCTPADKGDRSINRSIEIVRGLMMVKSLKDGGDGRPRLHILSNCKNLIREIPGYRWPEGSTRGKSPADVPVDVDNHAISALRYVVMSDWSAVTGGWKVEKKRLKREMGRHGVYLDRSR